MLLKLSFKKLILRFLYKSAGFIIKKSDKGIP